MSAQSLRKFAEVGAPRVVAARAPRVRRPIGQMLVEAGDLTVARKLEALELQSRTRVRFGEILLARGWIDEERLFDVIAEQYECDVADLAAQPPNAHQLDTLGAQFCLKEGLVPWRLRSGFVDVACSRPEAFEALRPVLEQKLGRVRMAIAPESAIHKALNDRAPVTLTENAEMRVARKASCRDWHQMALPRLLLAAVILGVVAALLAPATVLIAVCVWAVVTLLANSALKLAALLWQVENNRAQYNTPPAPIIARLPVVSIMVPLFGEKEIAGRLVQRLSRLTYPKAVLDICLVVEADDKTTREAVSRAELPKYMRVIEVPNGSIRTKPRALNYALDFCRGSIIGVYDAEDAPAPDQIEKVVTRFHTRGPEVACLQGVLDFYNARTNWLSRCFTLDFAGWFRTFLPGLAGLGFVVPLGGTTVFFRREALEKVGAWDAHNVTEDADLGIRLARHGYRTELIDTVTEEEANCLVWPWIKQRSRWLKGYTVTWAVHMREPVTLYRELGFRKFVGFQVFFLGTISQIALAPFLWSFWLVWLGIDHPAIEAIPRGAIIGTAIALITSEVINLAVAGYGARGPKHRSLIPWLFTMVLYHPLSAVAIYKGFFELLRKPFYWDKTRHGRFDRVESAGR